LITTPSPPAGILLKLGSVLGLFSREAEKEHKTLFRKTDLFKLTEKCGLKIQRYERFVWGLNQFLVLTREDNQSQSHGK